MYQSPFYKETHIVCILAVKANLWVIENALRLGVPLPLVTFLFILNQVGLIGNV